MPFSQPAWTEESGLPYPGAEAVASLIEKNEEKQQIAAQAKIEKAKATARKQGLADADKEEAAQRKIVAVRADQIAVRRQKWLWRDRFPVGGLSLVAGKGDTSKSTLFACFCAWITTGRMKGEFYGTPRDVAYIVNEDSTDITVVPRMITHGADLSRVHFPEIEDPIFGRQRIKLPRDTEALREYILAFDLAAVFIDPLSANVTGRKNDQGDMRDTYQEINALAESTGCAIVGLAHSRKAGGADVLEAVIGSSEQTNVARSVHGLVMDPEEDGARILSCEKLNVGQKDALASLRFRVQSAAVVCDDGSLTSQPRIEWLPETTESASDIMTDAQLGHDGVGDCARWLLKYLTSQGGEALSSDVKEAATKADRKFSSSMLNRARRLANVRSFRTKETPSKTIWAHPMNTESNAMASPLSLTQGGESSDISAGHAVVAP